MIRWPERRNDVLMAGGADGWRSTHRRGGSFRGLTGARRDTRPGLYGVQAAGRRP